MALHRRKYKYNLNDEHTVIIVLNVVDVRHILSRVKLMIYSIDCEHTDG